MEADHESPYVGNDPSPCRIRQIGESMTDLHDLLLRYVNDGSLPGAVGLVAHGDETEVGAVG